MEAVVVGDAKDNELLLSLDCLLTVHKTSILQLLVVVVVVAAAAVVVVVVVLGNIVDELE